MRAPAAFASPLALRLALAIALAAPAAASARALPAQDAVAPAPPRTIRIFRCTDASGRVTLQNDASCPKGTRQREQVVEAPPPSPAGVPRDDRPAAPAVAERDGHDAASAEPPSPGAATAPLARGRPPQLYACRTWDERDLLTEDATPAKRCAPLQVVAADGSVRSDAAACEQVEDRCEAVPPEALCTAWQRRVDEAEFRWRFAGARQDDDRRREYEGLRATLAQSDCAGGQNP